MGEFVGQGLDMSRWRPNRRRLFQTAGGLVIVTIAGCEDQPDKDPLRREFEEIDIGREERIQEFLNRKAGFKPILRGTREHDEVGGVWRSPGDEDKINLDVQSLLKITAEVRIAPTAAPLDTLLLTGRIPGVRSQQPPNPWRALDAISTPGPDGLYSTVIDLNKLGAQKGRGALGFDVFTQANLYKNSPNGILDITIVRN